MKDDFKAKEQFMFKLIELRKKLSAFEQPKSAFDCYGYDLSLYTDILNHLNDAIFIVDSETGQLVDVNDRACENLGYGREEFLEMSVVDIETALPGNFLWKEYVKDVRELGSVVLEGKHRSKDGTIFPVEISVRRLSQGKSRYMVIVSRDLRERKRGMEELKSVTASREQLSRDMTSETYPVPLKGAGLKEAVEWHVRTLLEPTGVEVFMEYGGECDGTLEGLPKSTHRVLFRIIREAFHNIIKYASATEVTVTCGIENGVGRLKVRDNGVGFSLEEIIAREERGIGQSLMRQWGKSIGGELSIRSEPGKGTEVYVEFPAVEEASEDGRHINLKPEGTYE